jgi:hypothetical protein
MYGATKSDAVRMLLFSALTVLHRGEVGRSPEFERTSAKDVGRRRVRAIGYLLLAFVCGLGIAGWCPSCQVEVVDSLISDAHDCQDPDSAPAQLPHQHGISTTTPTQPAAPSWDCSVCAGIPPDLPAPCPLDAMPAPQPLVSRSGPALHIARTTVLLC